MNCTWFAKMKYCMPKSKTAKPKDDPKPKDEVKEDDSEEQAIKLETLSGTKSRGDSIRLARDKSKRLSTQGKSAISPASPTDVKTAPPSPAVTPMLTH